jgi:hypothetical protein
MYILAIPKGGQNVHRWWTTSAHRHHSSARIPALVAGSEKRENQAADGLIVGSVGPFYVALNRATFYLAGAIFLTAAPWIILFIRDAATPVRLVVSFGVSMETGTLVHVWMERVRGMEGLLPWMAHLAVTVVLFGAILALLFGT